MVQKMTIDLDDFDVTRACDVGSELTVLHPTTGEELDIVIMLSGPDSRRAREADRSMTDLLTKEAIEKKLTPDDATFERMASMRAAGLVIDWRGIEWGGKPFPFTIDNAIKLFTERRWIRTQVETFASQRANFFKA